jgi:hypothetical protein
LRERERERRKGKETVACSLKLASPRLVEPLAVK